MSEKSCEFPTLIEIKEKIPKDCFESSLLYSSFFMVRSLLISMALVLSLAYLRSLELVASYTAVDTLLCLSYIYLQVCSMLILGLQSRGSYFGDTLPLDMIVDMDHFLATPRQILSLDA